GNGLPTGDLREALAEDGVVRSGRLRFEFVDEAVEHGVRLQFELLRGRNGLVGGRGLLLRGEVSVALRGGGLEKGGLHLVQRAVFHEILWRGGAAEEGGGDTVADPEAPVFF